MKINFKRAVSEETDCGKCIHREVCDLHMEKRCENYVFGTSAGRSCQSCLHRHTRYAQVRVPCFSCPWFQEGDGRSPKDKTR